MSMLTAMGRRPNGNAAGAPVAPPPPPSPYAPKVPPGPHQLGSVTIANVDQLTGMTAEEIERAADQIVDAAHETAEVLREAARRVRHSGLVANERLANYVAATSTCVDAALMMQTLIEERDKPRPATPPVPERPAAATEAPDGTPAREHVHAETGEPTDLDTLAERIGLVARDGAVE
jgi:hypothetical protein